MCMQKFHRISGIPLLCNAKTCRVAPSEKFQRDELTRWRTNSIGRKLFWWRPKYQLDSTTGETTEKALNEQYPMLAREGKMSVILDPKPKGLLVWTQKVA